MENTSVLILIYLIQIVSSLLSLAWLAMTIWMLYECVQKDEERHIWFWIILIIQPIGAFLYFFIRWLPRRRGGVSAPSGVKRWSQRRELSQLKMASRQIGNAYQFIQLGDKQLELRDFDEALTAYDQALDKEPSNLQALWGAAVCHMHYENWETARKHLTKILDEDPNYKFGDVSQAYGRALLAMGELDAARVHLEKHVQRWRQPESIYLLAETYAQQGEEAKAREQIEALLLDIESSPPAIARKQGTWKSKAKKLRKQIG